MKPYLLVLPLALASSVAAAQPATLAVGANLGLMGAGLEVSMKFNDQINGRLATRFGSLDADGEEDGINYEGSLDLGATGVLVDYHPWKGSFRVTAGMYSNSNELDLTAYSPDSAEIGGRTYNIDNGSVNTLVDFESTAPYLGVGWGNPVSAGSRWTFMTDIGILFQGSPRAAVSATGTATESQSQQSFTIGDGSALDLEFQAQLEEEERNLNDELEDFEMLPVVSVGMAYRF